MSNLQRWGEAHISPSGHLFCKIEAAHLLRVADFFEAPSSSNADETGVRHLCQSANPDKVVGVGKRGTKRVIGSVPARSLTPCLIFAPLAICAVRRYRQAFIASHCLI